MTVATQTVVGELSKIARALGDQAGSGDQVAPAGPFEKSFVRYSEGKGTFYEEDGTGFIVVEGRMYTLNGTADGLYQAVFKAWFQDPLVLLKHPKPPEQTFDRPSPVEAIKNVNDTKAKWTFGDSSYIVELGPAISYLAPVRNGGFQFWVSAAAFLTNGGGRYADAIGQETSLGSTWFAGPPDLKPGTSFPAKVTHSFRIILGSDRGTLPPGLAEGAAPD